MILISFTPIAAEDPVYVLHSFGLPRTVALSSAETAAITTVYRNHLADFPLTNIQMWRQERIPSALQVSYFLEANFTLYPHADIVAALFEKEQQIINGLRAAVSYTAVNLTAGNHTFPETCENTIKDLLETDVDCGGTECYQCIGNQECLVDSDCLSLNCFDLGTPPKKCIAQSTSAAVFAAPAVYVVAALVALASLAQFIQ